MTTATHPKRQKKALLRPRFGTNLGSLSVKPRDIYFEGGEKNVKKVLDTCSKADVFSALHI
jgi:hypothetical protein